MLKRFSRNPRAECVYLAGTMTGWRSALLIIIVIIACRRFNYQYHHLHQILVSTFNLFICSDVRWWANLPGRVTGCASWRWSSSYSTSCCCSYLIFVTDSAIFSLFQTRHHNQHDKTNQVSEGSHHYKFNFIFIHLLLVLIITILIES